MNFEEKKEFIKNCIIFYRDRGYTLKGNINTLLKNGGLFSTKTMWEETLKEIDYISASEVGAKIVDDVIAEFEKDLIKTILFREKYLSIYIDPKNFDNIFLALEKKYKKFDDNYHSIINSEIKFGFKKIQFDDLYFYISKDISTLTSKIDLGLSALKDELKDSGYQKVFAFKEIEISSFNSIIVDKKNRNIILSADLANHFQIDQLRQKIAGLVNLIRTETKLGHTIEDTGINLFPCIQKLYDEKHGFVKELAFKTDEGVSHREIAKAGKDVREGEYHTAGSASTDIESYDIKKSYGKKTEEDYKEVILKGSWYILSLPTPILTNLTIHANTLKSFNEILTKIIKLAI